MITYRQSLCLFLLLLFVLPVLAGCEESVDPIIGTEKAFSLYGVLTPRRDTQSVRVYTFRSRLRPLKSEPLGASFTSIDLQTGKRRTWQDSLIQEPDSQWAHVYWAPFKVEYGHTYQLKVSDPARGTATATVEVPPEAELIQQPPITAPISSKVVLPVLVKGESFQVRDVQVAYYIQYSRPSRGVPLSEITMTITLPYEAQKVAEGWRIEILLHEAYRELERRVYKLRANYSNYGIYLHGATIKMKIMNEEWYPPSGEFDREVLVHPGTMSNVENGFGFVGGGYPLSKVLQIDKDLLDKAGFRSKG